MNTTGTHDAGFWECIREDWCGMPQPYTAIMAILGVGPAGSVLIYRIAHALKARRVRLVPNVLRVLNRTIHHCDINPEARVGPGLRLPHPTGVMLGGQVRAGRNCTISQHVTIGGGSHVRDGRTQALIGNNVTIRPGAVLSGPVNIGDHAVIGSRTVVTKDVASGALVGGIPARIVSVADSIEDR